MMHPAFAARRGTRPRGEANLLAIITSKHVSWSNGPAGRPVSNSWPQGFVPALFFSSYFRKRKKDGRRQRERERERGKEKEDRTALQVAVCTHKPYTDARKRASPLPSPSPRPLTLRSRSGPWNPVLDIKQDQICRVAPPNRCMYAQDQVQSTGRRNHGITFVYYRSSCNRIRGIRGPTIFLGDFFSSGSPRIYISFFDFCCDFTFCLFFFFSLFFEIKLR